VIASELSSEVPVGLIQANRRETLPRERCHRSAQGLGGVERLTETPSADARSSGGNEPTTPYKDQELERLWAHNLHEDNMFMQRGNFFLVAESMLLIAYAAVLASRARTETDTLTASRIIAGFGLALTGVWSLISYRHLTYQRLIRQRALDYFREFCDTRAAWRDSQSGWWRKIHTNSLLTYGVPGLAGIMWLLLLILI
jgi:hypothetical protein